MSMIHKRKVIAIVFFVTISALFARDEFKLSELPADQSKLFSYMISFKEKKKSIEQIKNPFAREEAEEEFKKTSYRELSKSINKKLMNEGAMNWIGRVKNIDLIDLDEITVEAKIENVESYLNIVIIIDKKELSNNVFNTVKELKKGDKIRYTISPQTEKEGFFLEYIKDNLYGAVGSQLFKRLEIIK